MVRDRILENMETYLDGVESFDDARVILQEKLTELSESASDVICENGFDYSVSADLTVEYYPTKEYADITLPSGEYNSLRITIGEGKGQNWWCVVFPPLCLSAAEASFAEASAAVRPLTL